MQNLLTPAGALAAVLLVAAGSWANAQTLGTPMADVLMGRPLDLSLPVRLPAADGDAPCVQADVFYGETRLRASDVRTTVSGPGEQRRIRVEASVPIDEPFVTVSVRAGCASTVTRSYTLLPQVPSEQLLAKLDARAALSAATPVAPLKLARAAAPRAPRKSVVRTAPRLRVEPLDLPEGDALLRVSPSLAEPNGDASRRAAAALLWQAVNADPQEVLRTSVMLQKLEQDVAQLRQASDRERAVLASLRARLDEAQPWYLASVVVQSLLALVLAAGVAAAVLWARTRRLAATAGTWYLRPDTSPDAAQPMPAAPAEGRARATLAPAPGDPAHGEPVAADAAGPVDFEAPADPAAEHTGHDAVLRVETLAATFEEMDFLCAMRLTADAMDVLKLYVQDSTRPSPLAYLALMHLCEQAGDSAAVAAVRRRYAKTYRVEAPRPPQVAAEGGLETLPRLAARVTQAWGRPHALATLEEILFEAPTPAAPITLQAVRELLSLHDLALALAAEADGNPAQAHPIAPWVHDEQAQALPAAAVDADPHLGLDLDLGAAVPESLPDTPAAQGEVELARLRDKLQAEAVRARAQQRRRQLEQEDAFSAAVARERIPVSRY